MFYNGKADRLTEKKLMCPKRCRYEKKQQQEQQQQHGVQEH